MLAEVTEVILPRKGLVDNGRDFKRLQTVLIDTMDKQLKTGNVAPKGNDYYMEFDIECIPKELRAFFKESIPVLWGEQSATVSLEGKRCVYIRSLSIEDNKVKITFNENW